MGTLQNISRKTSHTKTMKFQLLLVAVCIGFIASQPMDAALGAMQDAVSGALGGDAGDILANAQNAANDILGGDVGDILANAQDAAGDLLGGDAADLLDSVLGSGNGAAGNVAMGALLVAGMIFV